MTKKRLATILISIMMPFVMSANVFAYEYNVGHGYGYRHYKKGFGYQHGYGNPKCWRWNGHRYVYICDEHYYKHWHGGYYGYPNYQGNRIVR